MNAIYVIDPHHASPAIFTDAESAHAYVGKWSGEIVDPSMIDPELRARVDAMLAGSEVAS